MKNINKILSLGLVSVMALGMTSCAESFLDTVSKTEPNSNNYYKTESQAERALLGCYDGWRQISSAPGTYPIMIAASIMSDECYGGAGMGDGYGSQNVDRFSTVVGPSEMNMYEQDWKSYYAALFRCNTLITQVDNVEWSSDAKKNQILGEARAIRAFLYFDMVRLWGNIPLFTEPSSENREQADPKDVYALIFSDLKFGMENIPADAYTSADDFGRVTKYACEAILARAYLFYNGYIGGDPVTVEGTAVTKADALAACEDVIASGRYQLVPEFKNLWPAASLVPLPDGQIGWDPEKSTYAGDANSEVILCQMFTPTQDYNGNNDSNRWLVNIGMRSVNWSPYGKGWGIATISPNYYSSLYTSADGRRVASVIDMVNEGVTSSPDFANAQKDWREYTGYMNKKYCPLVFGNNSSAATNPEGTGDFMTQNAQTWIIMRYADVLLMAAELGSSNGGAYLDQVRSRAGLGHLALNQQNIMAERARELAFEGVRYWDLLRQGVEVMADAVCASAGAVLNGGNDAQVSYDRAQIIKTKGLCQIPYNQITLSHGVLKQNEGW